MTRDSMGTRIFTRLTAQLGSFGFGIAGIGMQILKMTQIFADTLCETSRVLGVTLRYFKWIFWFFGIAGIGTQILKMTQIFADTLCETSRVLEVILRYFKWIFWDFGVVGIGMQLTEAPNPCAHGTNDLNCLNMER